VNDNDVLAFQDNIEWDIKLKRRITGTIEEGLFNVKLSGNVVIAITTHYNQLTLWLTPDSPKTTDPNATVAWSRTLKT